MSCPTQNMYCHLQFIDEYKSKVELNRILKTKFDETNHANQKVLEHAMEISICCGNLSIGFTSSLVGITGFF